MKKLLFYVLKGASEIFLYHYLSSIFSVLKLESLLLSYLLLPCPIYFFWLDKTNITIKALIKKI